MAMLLERVKFSFGGKEVLRDFSMDAPRGITVLRGPSGSGKTTALHLAAGLLTPHSGTVHNPGRVSIVFQEDRLLPWSTAEENVAFVLKNDSGTAARWLERVELGGELHALPASQSGGMKRRVAIARALAYDGDLLLLDEPFKGLDPELRERIFKLIREFAQKKPVILVTHEDSEARYGDYFMMMQ